MNLNSKKAFSLLELIVSISIISIITIFSMKFYKETHSLYDNKFKQEKAKIQFLTTKLFLENNKHLEKLSFNNDTIYYDNNVLLKKVTKFESLDFEKYSSFSICIETILCQEMVILK